jgi:hypothetical protein
MGHSRGDSWIKRKQTCDITSLYSINTGELCGGKIRQFKPGPGIRIDGEIRGAIRSVEEKQKFF